MMRTMAMVAAVLVAGCSGGDAATTGDGGDFLGGDLAGRDGGSQAPADLAAPAAVGYVTMVSNSGTSGGTAFKQTVATAFFERIAPSAAAACTTTTSGSCIVTSCVVPHTDGGVTPPAQLSAGVVTIAGGTQAATLTPKPDGSYTPFSDNANTLWSGGETISVAAAGDAVPAFSTSLTAPSQVVVTAPSIQQRTTPLPIDRTVDMTVTWTGGVFGDVSAGGSATLDSPASITSVSLVCKVPASDGQLTLPSALLQQLPSGGTASFFTQSIATAQTWAGEFYVTANAITYGRAGDGNVAVVAATITR